VGHSAFVNAFIYMSIKEKGSATRRLRKFGAGRAEKRFGISVARPAGLFKPMICRATELLNRNKKHWDVGTVPRA